MRPNLCPYHRLIRLVVKLLKLAHASNMIYSLASRYNTTMTHRVIPNPVTTAPTTQPDQPQEQVEK